VKKEEKIGSNMMKTLTFATPIEKMGSEERKRGREGAKITKQIASK